MKMNKKIIRLRQFIKSNVIASEARQSRRMTPLKARKSVSLLLVMILSLFLVAVPMAGTAEAATPIYVDATQLNDSEDGTSWEKAKKTIQEGINVVDSGGTVNVAAGTYEENLVVNKWLTLQGAGNGSDPSSNTVIMSSGSPVIDIIAGGNSEIERLIVKDLRVTDATGSGNTGSGILINSNDPIGHITFDNVASVDNEGYGIAFDGYDLSDIVLRGCFLSENFHGFRLPSSANSVSGIVVEDCVFDDNVQGGIMSYSTGYNLDGLTVQGGSFTRNAFGIMLGAENLTPMYIRNVYITGTTFDDNNKDPNYQYALNVYVWGSTEHAIENININHCTIKNHDRFGVRFYDFGMVEAYKDVVINAENNWWGDASGPSGVGLGSGDAVSDNVDFIPFLGSGGVVVNKVSITKSGPTSANSGVDITYTITYKNIGTNYANNVVIAETYPPEVEYVSADPEPNTGNNQWTIGTLDPGEGGTITVTVHIK